MDKKIKVYMGIPSTGERTDAQCYMLRKFEREYSDRIEFVYPSAFIGRIFHDYARNSIVEEFLDSDCDVLWFLDSDIVPHPLTLTLFDKFNEWELAGCPYPVFMRPAGMETSQIVYTVYKNMDGKFTTASIPGSGRDYVDGIATGCIFIKREVFEELKKPYFEFKYDAESRQMTEGEDLGFCRKTHALGKKFYIDYSLVAKHFKKVDLTDVNDYAIEYANRSVTNYDRSLREAVARKRLGL